MAPKKHGKRGNLKRKSKLKQNQLSKREKKDMREYGELDPLNSGIGLKGRFTKMTDVEDNNQHLQRSETSDSSEEEVDAYQQLVASVHGKLQSSSVESDNEVLEEEVEESSGKEDVSSESDGEEKDEMDAEQNGKEVEEDGFEVENESDEEDESGDEEEILEEEDGEKFVIKECDPFSVHFEIDLPEAFVEGLSQKEKWKREEIKVKHIGHGLFVSPEEHCHVKDVTAQEDENDLKSLYVKHKLAEGVESANRKLCKVENLKNGAPLSAFQMSLFQTLNKYQDVYYPERSYVNGEEIRLVYCLHALNHVLKTRSRVITHNTKMKLRQQGTDFEEYQDQGLTRPKVLIVLPFRDSALKVVNIMMQLLMSSDQSMVSNKKRFQTEYSEEDSSERKVPKPEDFEATFTGNIDDHFRIGLGVAKKTLKLYTKFYASDIILASPLGLRTIIGVDGEKERDYDFLNSIELLIFDQADIFLMQNWEHISTLMAHLHLQPREAHGADFSRVRMWTLNGWSKYYRQTVIFSSLSTPELNALHNRHCCNYAGKLSISRKETKGTICHIVKQLPQVFHKLPASSYAELPDVRFDFFLKKILPTQKDPVMSQTLIFISSYFDYVRIRNYFVREDIEFAQINEYSSTKTISRSRSEFFHGRVHFLLYTERIHFYKRLKLRGIRHIVFYELPRYPHFYSEMCNMLQDSRRQMDKENMTSTVLYSSFDAQRLADIVGTDRAARMINSTKKAHMFVTGENS
ncbi:U3 small nucleolar RNA-associated protein 25 homolog [Ostrea edulis]|uniref:U3 small nucleolar RNA-associated protein 25 homolog n=1 Tax=Ostrea edulis TaxID=37623 RepID=UPI0024AF6C0C|nr:U3 small nucleolar RNA-associated protein 25 homolog [Ostrea edulis]